LDSLQDVFQEQIDDLYDAEKQLVEALPRLANAASDEGLRHAFQEHLEETRVHVTRLAEIRDQLGWLPPSARCKGMEGLVEEGTTSSRWRASLRRGRRADRRGTAGRHYEIAAYGTARTLADRSAPAGLRLPGRTLDEEGHADKTLTKPSRRLPSPRHQPRGV
jgi:ferritin-like metal-binding protein YciE